MNQDHKTINDFLLDEAFIKWVYGDDPTLNEFWNNYVAMYPEKEDKIEEARMLLYDLQFKEDKISEKRIEAISRHIKNRIQVSPDPKLKLTSKRRWFYKIAAVFILIVMAGLLYQINEPAEQNHQIYNDQLITKSNSKGQKSTLTLSDGSTVRLNSESSLSFPVVFSDSLREVTLIGEAFFSVKNDRDRPFVVRSGNITTTVLGTSFNIKNYQEDNQIQVALASGKISVATKEKESEQIILKPDEQILYNKNSADIVIGSFNRKEVFAWKENTVYFKNATMLDIKRKLERWYDVEISIAGKPKSPVSLSTTYTDQSLENVLISLGYTLHFTFKIENNKVEILFTQ